MQDAAYQSLLRRTRQEVHQQVAKLLEARFPEVTQSEPEVVAHHYTEAGCHDEALRYWQSAGQRAARQSAHQEVIAHLSKGLEVLALLPDRAERAEQELDLQMALGPALMAVKGRGTSEVERTYTRARELCQQMGETPKRFPVLWGLWRFYNTRGELHTAREQAEQLLMLAQQQQEPALCLVAHQALGSTVLSLGEFVVARGHFEAGLSCVVPKQQSALALRYGSYVALTRHLLGWALFQHGQHEEGLGQMRQSLAELQATGTQATQLPFLLLVAEACGQVGQIDEGVAFLAGARTLVEAQGQQYNAAELYRIEGVLQLQQPAPDVAQAQTCFQQALDIARQQQAKSWELRAALSLSRLWQQQGNCQAAYDLLISVYEWFNEGFDTAALMEAKALLDELSTD